MDPLKPLRELPEHVRSYYYRLAAALAVLVTVIAVAIGGDAVLVGLVIDALLGFLAQLLAVAHTPPPSDASRLPPDLAAQRRWEDAIAEARVQLAPPRQRVRRGDPVPDDDPTTFDR